MASSNRIGWVNEGFCNEEMEMSSVDDPSYHIPRVRKEKPDKSHEQAPRYSSSHTDKIRSKSKDLDNLEIPAEVYDAGLEYEQYDYSLLGIIKRSKYFQKYSFRLPFIQDTRWLKNLIISIILLILYLVYFVWVLITSSKIEQENYWCRGDGFLIIITVLFGIGLIYFQILKPYFLKKIVREFKESNNFRQIETYYENIMSQIYVRLLLYIIVVAIMVGIIVYDAGGSLTRLVPIVGVAFFLLFGVIFSKAPGKIKWRHVVWGMSLQFFLGLMIIKWPVGEAIFDCIGEKVHIFLQFTDEGSSFVFGKLITEFQIFAFKVLSVIIFFSLCIQILYYYGIMQWIVLKLGWVLQITIGTTACESVNASANIFLGQSEAPLLIKPFLKDMTLSELHAVMTGGFATIAGTVLAAYISFGVDPSHLLSASVMSAPAALAYAKLFYPETEVSKTSAGNIKIEKSKETNALHAALEGVTCAIPLVSNIAANLLAFIAFIALFDTILNWLCVLANVDDGVCNLKNGFGYFFWPVAWLMGVPWDDGYYVGQLIGTKTIINEFVAYIDLGKMSEEGLIRKRSEIIATYALCGFSNISSIGIQLGSLGAMAPSRRGDLSRIAFRAMIAGNIACFLTACIAGSLITVGEFEHHKNFTVIT